MAGGNPAPPGVGFVIIAQPRDIAWVRAGSLALRLYFA
jgi:hypothetical protein